jgi:hypothetical protein
MVLQEWINASLSVQAASFLCANTSGQLYAITYQGEEWRADTSHVRMPLQLNLC